MGNTSTRPRNLCWAISIIGLILFCLSIFIMKSGNCSAMVPTAAATLTTVLLGLLGAGRAVFSRRQALEEQAAEEYRREHGNTELFDDADEAVRMATRANVQYIKYFVPIFTIVLGLVLGICCIVTWRAWNGTPAFPVAPNPMPLAILAICCCIAILVSGSFFVGASREPGCRWLRPAGAWLFFSGLLFLGASISLFLEYFKKAVAEADITTARIGLIMLAILAVELILSFVIEFYRPRMPGEEERPLPESRILALFTEPGGVARNVAASLDYQFGFQVSEVWFYRFLERTVVPLLVLMVIALWLQTCLIVVSTEENGLLERFGKVVSQEPLKPGLYIKLPWPFSRINRFPVEHVQELTIGEEHQEAPVKKEKPVDDGHGHHQQEEEEEEHDERLVLWASAHADEENNFIVATTPEKTTTPREENSLQGPPLSVGLLAAHIPLYFKVKNLYNYAYLHKDPSLTLKNLATRELLRYLTGVDLMEVLGPKRSEAREILRERIQASADAINLGIEVVFIGLAGLHPPVTVGGAFDNFVASREAQYELELKAQAYAVSCTPTAEGLSETMLNNARAYKEERVQVSQAEAERFLRQLKSFQASPELFKLNSFLEVLNTQGASARKYVLTSKSDREVLIFNLEKKIRSSLLDLNVDSEPSAPAQ